MPPPVELPVNGSQQEPRILTPQQLERKERTERCVEQINAILAQNNCRIVPFLIQQENGIVPAVRIEPNR